MEHGDFFEAHAQLLRDAWAELGLQDERLRRFHDDFVCPGLAEGVAETRAAVATGALGDDPEEAVRAWWSEVAPGVWSAPLLRPAIVASLRAEIERAAGAGIPTRRPNGMNRFGVILDSEVDGAVSYLGELVAGLVRELLQPIGRMLFPANVGLGDDEEWFAFTVYYRSKSEVAEKVVEGGGEGRSRDGRDVALAEHRDASVVTLNLNLNAPGEGFGGSSLTFVDERNASVKHEVKFEAGHAIIHLGSLRHSAQPIESGERQNLIVWLFGRDGDVRVAPYADDEQMGIAERWGRRSPPEETCTLDAQLTTHTRDQ